MDVMDRTEAFDALILSLTSAARELGVDQERQRIVRLIEDSVPLAEGGPKWADRLIARIEKGDA